VAVAMVVAVALAVTVAEVMVVRNKHYKQVLH
jgi:hypothetical protein